MDKGQPGHGKVMGNLEMRKRRHWTVRPESETVKGGGFLCSLQSPSDANTLNAGSLYTLEWTCHFIKSAEYTSSRKSAIFYVLCLSLNLSSVHIRQNQSQMKFQQAAQRMAINTLNQHLSPRQLNTHSSFVHHGPGDTGHQSQACTLAWRCSFCWHRDSILTAQEQE